MKSLSLVIFWIALASCLFAQKEEVTVKKKVTEKSVSVNVDKESEGERTIKITTEEDGEKKVIEWTDNGTIPEEIKKKLQEEDIDLSIIEPEDGDMIKIEVDGAVHPSHHKKMIVIRESDGQGLKELEWDGEGDMPIEMKELLDEHEIVLDDLHEGQGKKKKRKAKMRIIKDKQKAKRRGAMRDGKRMNRIEKKSYKIITKEDDGTEKVMEWNGEGDMPEGMEDVIEDHDVRVFRLDGHHRRNNGRQMMFFSDDDDTLSDAYMGAQIESEDNGARIIDVMKDSPADKAGLRRDDVIRRVNGARSRSMDDLLQILTYFEPNDQVELLISRDGKEEKLNMTLGERPESYR